MGTVSLLSDYRRASSRTSIPRTEPIDQSVTDPDFSDEYRRILYDAVSEELCLYDGVSYNPKVRLDRATKVMVGRHLEGKGVLQTPAIRLRLMIARYGLEQVQRLAERTFYRNFLRLAVVRGESGDVFIWRYCP